MMIGFLKQHISRYKNKEAYADDGVYVEESFADFFQVVWFYEVVFVGQEGGDYCYAG